MAAKKSVQVLIKDKVYTLSGYEDEEFLQKLASYINEKVAEFNSVDEYKHLSREMKDTFIELNLADDYYKAKSRVEQLENDLQARDDELYKLKHDLVSGKVKVDDLEKKVQSLEAENKELLLNKARLEASLEDAMLGTIKKLTE
ncbi:MAG: cell division protein ZapA [Lachnospiraceae bacterium]|nr:cell division protein ZapA [Lachnospiraceae bacterium]